jgi:hypothetical protein
MPPDAIACLVLGAATSKNNRYDIKLRVTGGKGGDGALGLDDLKFLIEFIGGVASFDESLSNLSLVGVLPGSVCPVMRAEPPPGMPGLFTAEDKYRAIGEVFDQKRRGKDFPLTFPDKVLEPLRSWTGTGVGIEISYRKSQAGRPKRIAADFGRLAKSVPKPPRAIEKKWLTGKVERLSKDRQEYGIKTVDGGVLVCPMDEQKAKLYLDCYAKDLTVEVLASFPPKTQTGQWNAKKIHEIIPRKQPLPLIEDHEADIEFDLKKISSVVIPKSPQPFGTVMRNFASGLTSEDADSLLNYLEEYRSQ